jgi:hypothetical protein
MWKTRLAEAWRYCVQFAHARPRVLAGVGVSSVVTVAVSVAFLVGSGGPPKVHFPPRPKLEPLVFSYPPNAVPEGSPRAVVPEAPKTFSGVQSAGLELVRSENGRLSALFAQQGACGKKPCNARIVAKWAEGYIPTGRGEEVVRLKHDPKS